MNKTPQQQDACQAVSNKGFTFSLAMSDGSYLFTHPTDQAGACRQNRLAMVTPDARIIYQD